MFGWVSICFDETQYIHMPMDLKPTRARYLKDANEVSHPPVIWSFKCLIVLRSVTIVIILTDFCNFIRPWTIYIYHHLSTCSICSMATSSPLSWVLHDAMTCHDLVAGMRPFSHGLVICSDGEVGCLEALRVTRCNEVDSLDHARPTKLDMNHENSSGFENLWIMVLHELTLLFPWFKASIEAVAFWKYSHPLNSEIDGIAGSSG